MILEGGAILMKLNQLDTEKVNQNSLHIDEMSTIDILKTINNEESKSSICSTRRHITNRSSG